MIYAWHGRLLRFKLVSLDIVYSHLAAMDLTLRMLVSPSIKYQLHLRTAPVKTIRAYASQIIESWSPLA